MPGTDANRQQRLVRRLDPAALGATIWIGVRMGAIEKLGQDDVEGGALGVRAG
jgi:hypothetical protein